MKRLKLLFTLALPVLLMQSAQAQTSSRLTAAAKWHNNGATFVPEDTTAYSYSHARGGDLMHTLKYDTKQYWVMGDSTFVNDSNVIQSFDSLTNNLTSKTYQYWNTVTGTWVNGTKALYFYTGNNLSNIVWQNWGGSNWVNVSRDVYSYDLANRLYQDQFQMWNSTTVTFDPSSQKTYYYDAASNLLQTVGQTYVTATSTYSFTDKYDYTYDTHNWQTSSLYAVWNGSAWDTSYMYSNTYDTAGDRTAQLYQTWSGSTSVWNNVTLKTYSNFTSMMPMNELDQVWDATGTGFWKNSIKYSYSYNSYHQLTNSVGESWNIAGFYEYANGDPMANYYYQTYAPAGINSVVAANGDVNIFPNPAQNTVNIRLNWNEAQASTISIFDMNGRIVRQWSVPSTTQYNTSISVDGFAAGNYVVKISGTQGQIVKQIVIAH